MQRHNLCTKNMLCSLSLTEAITRRQTDLALTIILNIKKPYSLTENQIPDKTFIAVVTPSLVPFVIAASSSNLDDDIVVLEVRSPEACFDGSVGIERPACLISDIIQHFVDARLDFDACYVLEDVKRAIGYVHQSGLVHRTILAEPDKYLVKNAAVLKFLTTLRERGKKLFLLTNSPFYFVDRGMRYMFQDFGLNGDSWLDLFEVVIALSDKPNFYTSDRPFRRYDMEKDIVTFSKVNAFQPHTVYYHGCLKSFLEITKWKGSEVIYFGDHLFSDLRGPIKAGWRTAAIIKELEKEIMTQNEDKYRFQQAKFHIVQEFLAKFHSLLRNKPRNDADNALLNAINEERQKSRRAMKAMFNPYFGAAFLTDTGRESAFAYNIQRYADVYTSRLENFLNYSSEAWLDPPYDVKIMPHHVKIPSSVLKTKAHQDG